MSDYLVLAIGLVLLIGGGELLVRGAATTAQRLGMSPLLIGLTLVGFGTSTPELVTSVEASLLGSPGIAVGNIVGSNIANVLLILGAAAMMAPIGVQQKALRRDGVFGLAVAAAFLAVGYTMPLNRPVGLAFFAILVAYLYYAYRQETAGAPAGHTAAYEKLEAHEALLDGSSVSRAPASEAVVGRGRVVAIPLAMAIGGLAIVVLGGKLLVEGAASIARGAGISEAVIGLTIVAVGTSLPELVTSVMAALRRQGDVALGNILGSNIYNLLGIGGVTALIAPTAIPDEIARFDSVVMLAAAAVLLVVARTGYRIGRSEGAVLFAGYCAYLYTNWPF